MNKHLKTAEFLTRLLDTQFKFLNIRFGIEPLLGLIPGLGDGISLALSCYLIWVALQLQIPGQELLKMIGNVIIDFVLGTLPIIGDVGDFFYKANVKNLEILKRNASVIEGEIIS